MKHLLEVCLLVLVSLHTVIGGCARARTVRDDKCQEENYGVDFQEGKQENENVFLNNDYDGEVANSKVSVVTRAIESVGHERVYENQHSTEQYEGEDHETVERRAGGGAGSEAVYWESSTEPGKVLGSDDKEELEILTDQLEDRIYETNVSENKSDVSDELLKTETLQRGDFESIIKSPGLEDVKVDDFMKSRIDFDASTENTEPHTSDNMKSFVTSPEKLTMEETIGDIWKEYVVERADGWTTHPSEDTSPKTIVYRNYFDNMYPSHSKLIMEDTLTTEGAKTKEILDEGSEHVLMEEEIDRVTTYTTPTTSWEAEQQVIKEDNRYSEDDYTPTTSHRETEVERNVTTEILPRTEISSIRTPLNENLVNLKEPTFSSIGSIPTAERLYSTEIEKDEVRSLSSKINDSVLSTNPINPQPLRDYEDKSEEDKKVIKSLLDDHPSFKKEKIEPGVLFEDCPDCDLRVLPIKPAEQRSTPEDDEEPLQVVKIKFAELPESRDLQINSLGLSDGIFLFSYLSEFLSWIQPNDFPVELLRDALKNQMSWIYLITQSVQVEAGFVACLVAVVLLAFAVPVVVLSHACYRMCGGPDDQAEESMGWAGNCRRRTLVFLLQIFLVLLCGGVVAMFVTNEQLSGAVVQSSEVLQTSLGDISSFVHDSHLQLHFLVTQSIDQAMQAVHADLDNVDTLLGRPIQRELVRETGLDVALESLTDLTSEAKQTTQQVERLLEEARTAQELQTAARDKLTDLRQQVELFRRACGPRDRTLCDTIDATGLDITLRLDRIKSDDRLNRMRRMGGVALEAAMTEAKERFLSIPTRVEADTRDTREEVRRQLSRQRAKVDERSLALERFAREVASKVNEAKYQAGFWMQDIDQYEYWRWIICIGGGAAMLMIWTLLLCSMCCGCCGSEKAAGPTILVTVVLLCLFSTALWTMVLAGLLVGGHGEVFLCRPLYDEPEFRVISQLVDEPGVFYDQPHGGFIANVIYGNDTLDVPIRKVLQECRANRPIYPTLGLGRVLDVEGLVSEHQWSSVHTRVRAVSANLSSLEVLSPALQDQLSDLLTTLSVNFTEHRIQMSKPVTGKDLDSFARQLDNIGNQMRDLATASRMETLSTRTRRLIDSHIRPLEGRKDALVYQLTALEVQTGPLQRQVNQSLSHLKTIQFFINSQGENIAQKKSREYVSRLAGYVDQLRQHVVDTARDSVAPCRPLWDIFNNSRLFLCRHTMDPLNGYWFATMWCLLVLLAATPVCLKLVDYYRAQGHSGSGGPSEILMGSEQGAGWSSPGYDIKCSKEPAGACK